MITSLLKIVYQDIIILVSNDMILRRRGGSLRVVVGTSIFWLSVFYTSSEWWCRNQQIKIDLNEPNSNHLADDLKPAQPALVDVIKEGVNKGFDGNDLDFNNPNKQPPPPQNLIVDYNNDKSEEKIVRGKFNPKVELQKVESSKKKSAKSKKNSKKRKKKGRYNCKFELFLRTNKIIKSTKFVGICTDRAFCINGCLTNQ